MYAIENYRKIFIFLKFLDVDKLLSTNFVENMNSALPSNIFFLIGECLVIGNLIGNSEKRLYALNFRKQTYEI